jgi:hypothetical protein
MATPLDLDLIDSYTRSMNVPVASQAGYVTRADAAGTNVEYVGPQVTAGGTTWDGKAPQILVGGSGARAVVLKNGYFLGQTVTVVDVVGNAGSGTITVSVSEGAIGGTLTITSNGGSLQFMYVAAGQWRRVSF